MPRLSTTEFWNRFLEYIRAVHDTVEERFSRAGETLSPLSSRASTLLGRLATRGAERALQDCIKPMLRNVNLREVIETLFEEMGYFIEITSRASEDESTSARLNLASTINESITSTVETLPF